MTVDQEIARATPRSDGCLLAADPPRHHRGATADSCRFVYVDGRLTQLHRAIAERFLRPLGTDDVVMRTCHEPRCIALAHLQIGTRSDHTAAMVAAGLHAHGEGHPSHVLTEDEVENIHLMRSFGVLYREIARYFGVSATLCRYIVTGRKWRHVFERLHGQRVASAAWPERCARL